MSRPSSIVELNYIPFNRYVAMSSRAYNVWTEAECEALREGVDRHGLGSWEIIRRDPSLPILQ